MKITEFGAIRTGSDIKKLRRKGAASESSFADILRAASESDEVSENSPITDIAATSAISNMLALQEISEEDVRRGKMVQRGKKLLDSLDKLRQALLAGEIPGYVLQELSRQLSIEKQAVSDPHLLSILEDIELRAAVELAKLEMASKDTN